ncbi:hypothetical protein B0H14DRAFT_3485741 [Mycena olivaceomarginata]|nr:hypothetical protein B0H14DRAFT_3485741 [Mycena olivaceomarginata]
MSKLRMWLICLFKHHSCALFLLSAPLHPHWTDSLWPVQPPMRRHVTADMT